MSQPDQSDQPDQPDQPVRKRFAAAPAAAALLSLALLAVPAPASAAPCEPGPAEARKRVSARVDALYRDAARATKRFEAARKRSGKQRGAVTRSRRAVSRGERRLDVLRFRIGGIARSQYRHGAWSPGARMVMTRTPEALLERLRAQRQADHAVNRLLGSTRTTQRQLVRKRARARAVLKQLEATTRREAKAKNAIERRLVLARRAQGPTPANRSARACSGKGREGGAGKRGGDSVQGGTRAAGVGGARWTTPVKPSAYTLSAGYRSSGARWSKGHTGQDFAVETGTPVRAVGAGTVAVTSCGDGFGNQVVIRHRDGYYSQYAHLSAIQTERGRQVRAGERIGLSGSTGNSTGPHLHFEARVTPGMGSDVAPVPWLRERGVVL
ncbi:peptidoglycan DD-metalloendopeptidase family protein [Streptomyces sp. NPDC048172]|uniref:M23 family metallopeptidase n=1 Tax=Streptomyces sp. NPDC048172 TaxID=3365505 RepID=UPI003715213E